jgi:DNA-binding transcriptional LysR family regulator
MSISKSSSFKQLVTFHKVARLSSVSQAAEELCISQSAASIQLANLEEATGTKLINRTGRGIRLTPAGEKLFEISSRMIDLWQEISDEMDSFLGDFTGTLRIGAVTTAEFWLPHVLVRFVNLYPKVQLKLKFANKEEIVRSLNSEEIDLALTGAPPEGQAYWSQSFANNPTAFVAASQHGKKVLAHAPRLSEFSKMQVSNCRLVLSCPATSQSSNCALQGLGLHIYRCTLVYWKYARACCRCYLWKTTQ